MRSHHKVDMITRDFIKTGSSDGNAAEEVEESPSRAAEREKGKKNGGTIAATGRGTQPEETTENSDQGGKGEDVPFW